MKPVRMVCRMLPFESVLANAVFLLTLCVLAVMVMSGASFTFGDDKYLVESICQGVPMRYDVGVDIGRCTPLTSQSELNGLLFLPRWILGYVDGIAHLSDLVWLFCACWLFVSLTRGLLAGMRHADAWSLAALVVFLALPKLLYVYWWNQYAESRMIVLFLLFAWQFLKGERSGEKRQFICAALAAAAALGYKETSFVLVSTFALTFLAFGRRRISPTGLRTSVVLLLMSAVYLAAFYFCIYRHASTTYHADRVVSVLDGLAYYFRSPEMVAALLLAIVRASVVLIGRSRDHLAADALLFSGIALVFAYSVIGLTDVYYITPAYAAIVPALVYWIGRTGARSRLLMAALCACMTAATALNACFARALWDWMQFRRTTELPTLRQVKAEGRRVCYYLPDERIDSEYYCRNVRLFLGHVGGDTNKFSVVRALPRRVESNQVLFVPCVTGMSEARREWLFARRPPAFAGCRGMSFDGSVAKSGEVVPLDWYFVVFGLLEIPSEIRESDGNGPVE